MKNRISYLCFFLFISNLSFAQERKPSANDIKNAVQSALERLTTYINYFAEKDATPETKEKYLDAIVEEFENGAEMEVSSTKRKETHKLPIKRYFNNLIYIREHEGYKKVIISFSNLKINSMTEMGNNKLLAICEYTQVFKGEYLDGSYGDITRKYSDVYIYIMPEKGSIRTKFGSTRVSITKKLTGN